MSVIRGKVEPKENNKGVMLLYQAVLEYAMGKGITVTWQSYLLYTLSVLIRHVLHGLYFGVKMDVRNRIVANEYGIQLRNPQYTAERLRDIVRESLNER